MDKRSAGATLRLGPASVRIGAPSLLGTARGCSRALNPVTCLILCALFCIAGSPSRWRAALALAAGLLVTLTPPLGYLGWLRRRGRLPDADLPRLKDRRHPLLLALLGTALGWTCLTLAGIEGPPRQFLAALLLALLALTGVTWVWQISFHAAAMAGAAGVGLAIFGPAVLPLLALVPLVGWARLCLRRHTLPQVVAGATVAFVAVAVAFVA